MMIYQVDAKVALFRHIDHGTRLLFLSGPTNPRDVLGKNGVTLQTLPSAWCISIQLNHQDEQGRVTPRVFHINRNSLRKYLGVPMSQKMSDDMLVGDLKNQLNNELFLAHTDLRHAGQYNVKPLKTGWVDALKASFLGKLYQWSIRSWRRLVARFILMRREQDLFEAGEILAQQRFHETRATVPAYKKHMRDHDPKTLADVPVTSKENYIKPQAYDAETHHHGRYPKKHKTDTSTGTTGKPTEWVRGEAELSSVAATLKLASKLTLGERPLFFINAFALGPWATGLTTYEMMRDVGSVFATGPDKEKILSKLVSIRREDLRQLQIAVIHYRARARSLSDEDVKTITRLIDQALLECQHPKVLNEKLGALFVNAGYAELYKTHRAVIRHIAHKQVMTRQQIIISGYPPFLKDLIDYAQKEGHDFHEFSAIGVVGGQGISEAMRDQLTREGFSKVYSSYGASDLDINIAAESDYEISVRKFLETHPSAAQEIYGKNKGLPMVFRYDPLNYHIECDETDELLFTCTRDDRSSPRVRYDLGDKGRVYAASLLQAVLQKHGFFTKPAVDLPVLMVWGRDATVVFNGANLEFTELERALTDNSELSQIVLKKSFYTHFDTDGREQLEIWLELKEGEPLPQVSKIEQHVHDIFNQLIVGNQDFRWQVERLDAQASLPVVRYFRHGESPISDAGGHRKQVLIFHDENLPDGYQIPGNGEKCAVVTVLKGELHIAPKPSA